jgi:hypothetical protein
MHDEKELHGLKDCITEEQLKGLNEMNEAQIKEIIKKVGDCVYCKQIWVKVLSQKNLTLTNKYLLSVINRL